MARRSSRPIKDSEKAKIKAKSGKEPVEHIVGYDAIAVYVQAKSSLESVDLQTLKEIFFEGGKINRWDQVTGNEGSMGDIERIGRANSSGTYAAFQKMVGGRGVEYKKGTVSMASFESVGRACGIDPAGNRLRGGEIRDQGGEGIEAGREKR